MYLVHVGYFVYCQLFCSFLNCVNGIVCKLSGDCLRDPVVPVPL